MTRLSLIMLLSTTIVSCSQLQNAQEVVAEKGAAAADQALYGAEWALCKAPTAGAIYRRYGDNPTKLEAWMLFCYPDSPTFSGGRVDETEKDGSQSLPQTVQPDRQPSVDPQSQRPSPGRPGRYQAVNVNR